jgi:uncharacterized membrane protein YcaP (DUF421 family)
VILATPTDREAGGGRLAMLHSLFDPGVAIGERILRGLLVYAFLLVAIRAFGRRELGQLTAFDLIVLLTLSNILQNAMIGNDNSFTGGAVGALVLLSANYLVAFGVFRSRKVERLVEGRSRILIQDGKPIRKALRQELLSDQELLSAVRREGLTSFEDVRLAFAEPNGLISVIPKSRGSSGGTQSKPADSANS